MDSNPTARRCPRCGAILERDLASDDCPVCLMKLGVMGSAEATRALPSDTPWAAQGAPPVAADGGSTLVAGAVAASRFGDYELLKEIGRGGMGVVYRARQISLDRIVAVKLILTGPWAGSSFIRRFQAEARAAASLHHPNIVGIYEIGQQDGQHFYSMEYVEGRTLADIIRDGPVEPRCAAGWVKAVAQAVQCAHEHGVLHRDLKPSNVMVDGTGQIHVTDFGLAKRLSGSAEPGSKNADFDLTVTGQVLGTPNYLAPEQALARKEISPAADVYGLGGILYSLLTGRPPFQAATLTETLQQVVNLEPIAPRLLNPAVPPDLETICLKCLEKDPTRRYASARDVAEEFGRFLEGSPIHARAVSMTEKGWRWCRRRPLVASLAATTVLLLLVLAVGSTLASWRLAVSRREIQASESDARRSLYAAEIKLAQVVLEERNLGRAAKLVGQYRFPRLGEEDFRGFEWRYLWQQCQGDAQLVLRGHTTMLNHAIFSPDGSMVATASFDGEVKVWESMTGRLIQSFSGTADSFARLPSRPIAFLPRGERLAVARRDKIFIHEIGSGRLERTASSAVVDWFGNLAQAPGGGRLAVQGGEHGLTFFDTTTWIEHPPNPEEQRQLQQLPPQFDPQGEVLVVAVGSQIELRDARSYALLGSLNWRQLSAFAISQDGLIAASGREGHLGVWDLKSLAKLAERKIDRMQAGRLAFSADGRFLVSAAGDQGLHFFGARDLTPQFSLRGHGSEVWSIEFCEGSGRLLTASKDGTARLWRAAPPEPPETLAGAFYPLWISPDSRTLIALSDGVQGLQFWDLASRTVRRELALLRTASDADPPLLSQAWRVSPGGRWVTCKTLRGTLRIWNLETGQFEASWMSLGGPRSLESAHEFFPDDARIAVSGQDRADDSGEYRVEVRRCPTGETLAVFPGVSSPLAVSPDGLRLAVQGTNYSILVIELASKTPSLTLTGHRWHLTKLVFSPSGRMLASASGDGTARLWDARTGLPLAQLEGHSQGVGPIAFAPDEKTLATGSTDGVLKLWQVATGHELLSFQDFGEDTWRIVFSPDGTCLAVGRLMIDGMTPVRLWRAPTLEQINSIESIDVLNPQR